MDPLIEIGEPAPDFSLKDLGRSEHRLSNYKGRIVMVNFWSAECPWAKRVDQDLLPRLAAWGEGVILLPVAANANELVEMLQEAAAERGLLRVLHDPHQQVADRYQAVTTPHFYVLDEGGILRYRGAYDDVTFRQRTPSRGYLVEAVEALLAGKNPDPAETPPYGCAVVRGN
jgi:thiol-disulfide isomerase/thioredoxin